MQPPEQRGASRMSPYIRYGLLPLRQVWDAVADAPARDRRRYRDELLWPEHGRHLDVAGSTSADPGRAV